MVMTFAGQMRPHSAQPMHSSFCTAGRERIKTFISRSFTLENVEEDRVTADYRDGMVLLTLPKREDVRRVPRRIELN